MCERQMHQMEWRMLDISVVSLTTWHRHILCKTLSEGKVIDKVFNILEKSNLLCMHFVIIVDRAKPRQIEQINKDYDQGNAQNSDINIICLLVNFPAQCRQRPV